MTGPTDTSAPSKSMPLDDQARRDRTAQTHSVADGCDPMRPEQAVGDTAEEVHG